MISDHRKLIGSIALTAFVFMAGSVICLASGQPAVMGDCGNQMQGATMCPFMSVSIPTVLVASFGKQITGILMLVLVVFSVLGMALGGHRLETVRLSRHRSRNMGTPPASFLNSVLDLISSGILHSRVFGL